jgi:FkbM family methyltransferase
VLKRTVISTLQPFVANRVYTVRHGLAKGLKRRGGLGFMPQVGVPTTEETFLQQLDLAGQTIFDVGGFEGIFTLFFARRMGAAGRLCTFEPNPRNFVRIVENVRLNAFPRVDVCQLALGAAPGHASLVFPPDETARGSLLDDIQAQIREEKHADTVVVEVETVDRLVARGLPEPDFVKIDVEGLERDVLEGMKGTIARRHPRLYIEIHGADKARKLDNATSVIEFLWSADYDVHHVESGRDIRTAADIQHAVEGHLYVAPRLLDR